MLFAYFGPETMLPLTSILAAAGGFFLMFGRQSLRIIRLVTRYVALRLGYKKSPAHHLGRVDRAGNRTDRPARAKYRPMAKDKDTDRVHS